VIPTVYCNNYLAALSGFSNRAGHGEQLIAVLEFAQRWSAAVDWSSYQTAHEILTACNAYADPNRAESLNLRLVMPTSQAELRYREQGQRPRDPG
jgi:hypothetical protein